MNHSQAITHIASLLVLVCIPGAKGSDHVSESEARNHPDVLIAAHRGGYESDKADRAPENSVANISVSHRKGFAIYETDIQRTADGHFVIMHDATLDRETTGTGHAQDYTLAKLKQLHKRYRDGSVSTHHIATLKEFLREGKNRTIFKADLKPGVSAHFPAMMQLVNKLDAHDGIIFRVPYQEADLFDQYKHGGIFTSPAQIMFKVSSRVQIDDIKSRFDPQWIQIDLAKTEPTTPTALDLIRYATSQGLMVETHAEGNAEDWTKLIRAGVRMFHTNRPTELKMFLSPL
ncbi:MAG: glycerophosphodiester phosphodiesterase family protein [Opitutaceae bacterium]|jgi:glycerophosphoryl diester phosphodiesterase|nr:glycerophosphodiester phosphodiesterase family protein [Opitutaceae bacterium]